MRQFSRAVIKGLKDSIFAVKMGEEHWRAREWNAAQQETLRHILLAECKGEMQRGMSGSSDMFSNVGIGITTKDRWDDLEATLTVLEEKGFSALETIVIDDGSSYRAPPALLERFPWVRFERSDRSYGLIVQRNRLARMLTSAYYLSLDDDSFPAAGDLGSAVQFLAEKPDTLGLAFLSFVAMRHFPARSRFPLRFGTLSAAHTC
jgi:hypothetical protein